MKTKTIAIMCVLLLSGCASTPPPPRPAPLNLVAYQDSVFTEAEALVDSLTTPKGAEDAER